MNEFLTWGSLGTYAGAVLFVGMVTQLFKGVGVVAKIPTRIFSYVVAVLVLVLAVLFSTETYQVADFALCFVNAVIVSLAANGAYDAVNSATK